MLNIYVIQYSQNYDYEKIAISLCSYDKKLFFKIKSHKRKMFFLFSRSVLYKIFIKEFNIKYSDIHIYSNIYGKTFLYNKQIFFDFNVSYSKDKVVIITSKYFNVGIDIESINYYKKNQLSLLYELIYGKNSNNIHNSFFNDYDLISKWTVIEAYLKLNGIGLNINPIEVKSSKENSIVKYVGNKKLSFSKANYKSFQIENEYILTICYSHIATNPIIQFIYKL